jgi:hypothetical protein
VHGYPFSNYAMRASNYLTSKERLHYSIFLLQCDNILRVVGMPLSLASIVAQQKQKELVLVLILLVV